MAKQMQIKRLLLLVALVCLAFVCLGYRLVDLQVLRHEELTARAQENTQREYVLEPRRGDILDVRGLPLASSQFVKTVCADPLLIGTNQVEVARAVAPLLTMTEADFIQRLQPKARPADAGPAATNHVATPKRYVVLKRKVPTDTWEKIRQAMATLKFGDAELAVAGSRKTYYRDLRLKGVFCDPHDDQLRTYPNQSLAAHVLGYVGVRDIPVNGATVSEVSGKDGIELMLNSKLAGVRGWRLTEIDRHQQEQINLREQDVVQRDGLNVVLTIDSVVQNCVESALAVAKEKFSPISISGLVIRPQTGAILAMATLPNFDPNRPGDFSADVRRNRAITDIAEPGSTFKIVVVSGALNDGTVRLEDNFDCENGHFFYAGKTLHDHSYNYSILSVESIITKSSNIGAAKIGIKMGEHRLYDYIRNYGFGRSTGIPLPGEVNGIVNPVKQWSKVSIAQIPMGHGVAVTRLQMAMAMCAIANKGWLMRPMLVDRLEDRDHQIVAKYTPERVRQVISEDASKLMVKALKTVVSPQGTAPKAALEHYTVAGKTGTAQKTENGTYAFSKFFSSFIGFFPADNPEVCIAISLDDPKGSHYGGEVAAPVFKQIAEQLANYLNIRPEIDVTATAQSEAKTIARSP